MRDIGPAGYLSSTAEYLPRSSAWFEANNSLRQTDDKGLTVYTQGSFDIVHTGHLNILRKCRKLAGRNGKVIVALTTDECYSRYRGYKPAKSFKERKAVLEEFRDIDEVIPVDNRKTKQQIKKLKPDWVVIGSDWASKDLYKQYGMTRKELDPLLLYVPYTTTISSTKIKERIKNGL